MKSLIEKLKEKNFDSSTIDNEERLSEHRRILENKPLTKAVFKEFHDQIDSFDKKYLSGQGIRVELGAGVAAMKSSYPDVLSSDIVPSEELDMVIDAGAMPMTDSSVRTVIGQNCFHHFPEPQKFLDELDRVLEVGGGAILIEPYYGPLSKFLYKRLFATEGFDMDFPSWNTPSSGPMNGANQALSYIVFKRDFEKFSLNNPNLGIVHQRVCNNYLSYILSGGLNFKQLWPARLKWFLDVMQVILTPVNHLFGVHHVIVIRKKK